MISKLILEKIVRRSHLFRFSRTGATHDISEALVCDFHTFRKDHDLGLADLEDERERLAELQKPP
jgi:hypothetical protein